MMIVGKASSIYWGGMRITVKVSLSFIYFFYAGHIKRK